MNAAHSKFQIRPHRSTLLIFVALFLCKLLLLWDFDLPAFGGGHDDYWFVLRSLDWYWFPSRYDQMTYIKEPLWPLLMAVLRFTFVPLKFWMEFGLFLTAIAAAFLVIPGHGVRGVFARVGLFVLLFFNPTSIPTFERTTYDPLYGMLMTILLSLSVYGCRVSSPRLLFRVAAATGLFGGLLSVTRSDGVLTVFGAVAAFFLIGSVLRAGSLFSRFRHGCAVAAVLFAVSYAVKFPFLAMTYYRFGNWSVAEQVEPNFERAMKALASVRPEVEVPHAVVSRATIETVSKHSAAMREISPHLLGAMGQGWAKVSLGHPTPPMEIGSGWLQWAVRDAVAMAGKYETPESARAFYRSLAREIEKAIRRGTLQKRWILHYTVGPLPGPAEAMSSVYRIVSTSLFPGSFTPVPEFGYEVVQRDYDRVTNRPHSFVEKDLATTIFRGELYSASKPQSIASLTYSSPYSTRTARIEPRQVGENPRSIPVGFELAVEDLVPGSIAAVFSDGSTVRISRDGDVLTLVEPHSDLRLAYTAAKPERRPVAEAVVSRYGTFVRMWFALFLFACIASGCAQIRNGAGSLLRSGISLLMFGLLVGPKLLLMALLDSASFFMTDWRYIFPISLTLAVLPFCVIGAAYRDSAVSNGSE